MKGDAHGRIGDVDSLSSDTALSPVHLERGGRSPRSAWIRLAVAGILLVCILLVLVDSFTTKRIETIAVSFFGWVQANPFLGVLSVVLVYIIATST